MIEKYLASDYESGRWSEAGLHPLYVTEFFYDFLPGKTWSSVEDQKKLVSEFNKYRKAKENAGCGGYVNQMKQQQQQQYGV